MLLLILGLPLVSQAQFYFATNKGTITITGYSGPGGAVTIPASIDSPAQRQVQAGAQKANSYQLFDTVYQRRKSLNPHFQPVPGRNRSHAAWGTGEDDV